LGSWPKDVTHSGFSAISSMGSHAHQERMPVDPATSRAAGQGKVLLCLTLDVGSRFVHIVLPHICFRLLCSIPRGTRL
jgi:hypothetical protein